MSPSRISTLRPRALRRSSIASESVLLPAPESPVNQIVNPLWVMFVHPPSFISIQFKSLFQRYSKNGCVSGTSSFPYTSALKKVSPAYRRGSARLAAGEWWEPYPSVDCNSVHALLVPRELPGHVLFQCHI